MESLLQLFYYAQSSFQTYPWLGVIVAVILLILVFRYLTALFKIVLFLVIFAGIIAAIAKFKN